MAGVNPRRPDAPAYAPAFVPEQEGDDWKLSDGRQCSHMHCTNVAVAALNRQRHMYRTGRKVDAWFHYCPDHMYGRWVEWDEVWWWKPLWPDEDLATEAAASARSLLQQVQDREV